MVDLGVGMAIKELGLKDRVCAIGFDNNTECVGMLETGELDTLIVQNPFSMGYLAVMNAANILSGKKTESVIKQMSMSLTEAICSRLMFRRSFSASINMINKTARM